jgi:hypothetical protein
LVFKPELCVFLDIEQQFVVTAKMLAEPIVSIGELAVCRAVVPAQIGPQIVDIAFVFPVQKVAPRVHHDMPFVPVYINRSELMSHFP